MCEDFDEDFCQCPFCSGAGEVDCHCGGDLCVCDNYGSTPCPLCHGDGEVRHRQHDRYIQRQRENARLFAEARARIDAEKEQTDPDDRPRQMPDQIIAWPAQVTPPGETALTGSWSARRHYTDEAVTYVRKDKPT